MPFYTLHKLMAGLLDQHTHAGSSLAYTLVTRMAAWVGRRVAATLSAGGEALWQRVLLTEWGGMNDVLYALQPPVVEAAPPCETTPAVKAATPCNGSCHPNPTPIPPRCRCSTRCTR